MQKKLSTWQFILKNLQENTGVIMLYVLESMGSSPGRQGFFMAVNTSGEMSGSVGGGVMEHKFVELAKNKLQQAVQEHSLHQQFHDKAAAKNQSGMICSGEQTIFIYTLQQKDILHVASIIASLQQNKNGTIELTTAGISFSEASEDISFVYEKYGEEDFLYKEKTGYHNHLYIVGGGHCSLAFSQLMSTMDFYIYVYDEREGLNTMEANHFVHERMIVSSYAALRELIPSGKNNYVVIMTFGYRTDDTALRSLLEKDFAYIGLLGSRKKIEKMFAELEADGIQKDLVSRIYSPIGVPIKSQTPEEIAVSIAAEIIQVKNKHLP
ncbi:MAG: XdhC family protein [Ferruginibacter sp.]